MQTILFNATGNKYEIPDEVYNYLFSRERDVKQLKADLTDLHDKIREWRVKTETYNHHKTELTGKAMNKAKNAVIYAVPGLTIKQVSLMLEGYNK